MVEGLNVIDSKSKKKLKLQLGIYLSSTLSISSKRVFKLFALFFFLGDSTLILSKSNLTYELFFVGSLFITSKLFLCNRVFSSTSLYILLLFTDSSSKLKNLTLGLLKLDFVIGEPITPLLLSKLLSSLANLYLVK